jgi:hypothetical protein
MGHDDYDGKNQSWVFLGDHASFYDKRIPFLYIGVEDHEDLHQPSDTWDKIDLTSYIENCNMIVGMIK